MIIEKFSEFLSKKFINFKQFIFLYSLVNHNRSLFDKYNNLDPINRNEIIFLLDNDLISIKSDTFDDIYYSKCNATKNAINLIKSLDLSVNNNVTVVNTSDLDKDFIEKWFNLWPKGITSGGYYVRTDKNGCQKNLQKFFKNHPNISKDTVLKATEKYLNNMKEKNYQMCKLAPYFVYKDGMSLLEGYCSNIEHSLDNEDDPFVIKV